jgi:hypothetical protein
MLWQHTGFPRRKLFPSIVERPVLPAKMSNSGLLSPLVTAERNAAKVQIQVARPLWLRNNLTEGELK